MSDVRARFAQDLRSRKPVAGTFVKSRDPATVEMLGLAGFDFLVLDAEHVAFDRADVANMAIASRAASVALLVRVPEASATWISTVVDAGCAGVVVPQVASANEVSRIVRMMRYGANGMGFSPSTPGADYGTRGILKHLERQPHETVLVCQIEDANAVDQASAIAGQDGVDGVLLGPVDLSVAMGANDPDAKDVVDACRKAIAASAERDTAAGLFLTDMSARSAWQERGASMFVLGSDQAFLTRAARHALTLFNA